MLVAALVLLLGQIQARVVQDVPSEEFYMNYKRVEDCDNPMSDGSCPLLGGPYRLPNIWLAMNGTISTEGDYKTQSALGYVPPPRAFHASAAFQNLLWITGGRTTPRGNYNTRLTDRLGDVWYSEDGDLWTQVTRLTGDFTVQETDAIQPGPFAPWWSRFGHSLTTLDWDQDGVDDAMVLMGGFAPEPLNDVWVTYTDTAHCRPRLRVTAKLSRPKMAGDGGCQQEWKFVHYAPWAPRGWHSAAVFLGRIFVMGGSPLTNDVWSANVTNVTSASSGEWAKAAGGLWFDWQTHYALNDSLHNKPFVWSPRAGHVAAAQHSPGGQEALLVMGGFGGWPCEAHRRHYMDRANCHPHYDGGSRARNDVWMSYDAKNWTLVTSNAPWGARAWAAGTVWHQPGNKTLDLNDYAVKNQLAPKIWISGGVYYGTKHRAFAETPWSVDRAIDSRTAYLDLWWSHDGKVWNESSFKTGVARNHDDFSTAEAFHTTINDVQMYLGKYGHTITPFRRIAADPSGGMMEEAPALFFIAGDRVPQTRRGNPNVLSSSTASYAADVFRTALGSDSDGGRTGILCNTGPTECSGHGTCCHAFSQGNASTTTTVVFPKGLDCSDRDLGGCVCDKNYDGEFCEIQLVKAAANKFGRGSPWALAVLPALLAAVNLVL